MRLAGMAILCAGMACPAFADWTPAPTKRPTSTPLPEPTPTPRPPVVLTPSPTPLPTPTRIPTPPPGTPTPGGGPSPTPVVRTYVVTFRCEPPQPRCTPLVLTVKTGQGMTVSVVPE